MMVGMASKVAVKEEEGGAVRQLRDVCCLW